MKKISAGLYITAIAAIAALVGLIAYMVNTGTDYFSNLGVDVSVVLCVAIAALLHVVTIVVGMKGQPMWADIMPVAASALLMLGTIFLVSIRVNGIASIMTFEGNASTMADLTSAIVAIAACLVATIFSIIAAFFDVTKSS